MKLAARKCIRCGHEWVLRKPQEPKICPKCKSPYWDRARLRKVKISEVKA